MASKVINKVMGFLGMAEDASDEIEEMETEDDNMEIESLMSCKQKTK